MEILSVGYNFIHNKDFKLLRPNGINEYLLLVIRSKAVFEMDGKRMSIRPYTLIFTDKNKPHSIYADNDVYVNDWITFDLTAEERKELMQNQIKINALWCGYDVRFYSDIIKLMQDEMKSDDKSKSINTELFFKVILNKLQNNSAHLFFDKKYYNELSEMRGEIYSCPQNKYTVEQLSHRVNLSKSYFQSLYKLYFNTTPISDVIKSRIEYSKQLLSSTDCSVSEISELCGYNDDARFVKQFKKIVNMTPCKYRKSLSRNYYP